MANELHDIYERLNDVDPAVRIEALTEAYWSERWDVFPLILEALHDPNGRVVNEAAWALEFYPSVAATLALSRVDWRQHFTRNDDALEEIIKRLEDVWTAASGTTAESHVRDWLTPVANLIDLSKPTPTKLSRSGTSEGKVTQPHLEKAHRWIADQGGTDGVLRLMLDETSADHGMAVYSAVYLPRNIQIADAAYQAIQRANATNSQRREAFATWLAHEDGERVHGRLRQMREHDNLAVRCAALDELGAMGRLDDIAPTWMPRAGDSVNEVVSWLRACRMSGTSVEPPASTWAIDSAWVKEALISGAQAGVWAVASTQE